MNELNSNKNLKQNEISIVTLIIVAKRYWHMLIKRWRLIIIFGLFGGVIGLVASIFKKPTYTAHLSFALIEKSSSSSGLADLASSFGLSNLLGGGQNVFSGNNLLEIMKSRHTIENTLLTPVKFDGKEQTLADAYIKIYDLRKGWEKNKKIHELATLNYPIGQNRNNFSRVQDSVLYTFYNSILKNKQLTIVRKDKKLSFVDVDFSSYNEKFSQLFTEKLMQNTYNFYLKTKTAQSRANIKMMQSKADSIKSLYQAALYKGADYSSINVNMAKQFAAIPRVEQETNAKLYATVYAEVLKNLETLKLDLARETPIIQIIDKPILPLKKERLGKLKGIVLGGFLGGLMIVIYLIGVQYFKDIFEDSYIN